MKNLAHRVAAVIPVVILLNYWAQLQQDPTIPLPCMVFSSNAKILLILTFKFPTLAPWTWGDGDTVRYHPEMRAGTDWLSTDSLDVTLARDDQPRCLSCSEGLSLEVLWNGEKMGRQGHYQSFSHCACWSEAIFGFPQLEFHWTIPRQGWCPAQQPWVCLRRWRGLFWWIQQVCHQDQKFTYQDSNFNFSQCFILFF